MTTKAQSEEPEENSKEYILNGLREAFRELKEVQAGRAKARPVRELLKELEEEDAQSGASNNNR